jgi:hypothetical protein
MEVNKEINKQKKRKNRRRGERMTEGDREKRQKLIAERK